jgi:hypothetical protein
MTSALTRIPPANYAIQVFGSKTLLARAIKWNRSAIHHWSMPIESGGAGGYIPRKAMVQILEKARELGLDLTGDDLILGREVKSDG